MEKKITRKEYFGMIKEVVLASGSENKNELVAFIERQVELIEKKAEKAGSKVNEENEKIKVELISALREIGKPVTISELQKESEFARELSNQKISALFRQCEEVKRTEEKGKAYFSVQ